MQIWVLPLSCVAKWAKIVYGAILIKVALVDKLNGYVRLRISSTMAGYARLLLDWWLLTKDLKLIFFLHCYEFIRAIISAVVAVDFLAKSFSKFADWLAIRMIALEWTIKVSRFSLRRGHVVVVLEIIHLLWLLDNLFCMLSHHLSFGLTVETTHCFVDAVLEGFLLLVR